jgi:hypothetical protein
LWGSILKTFGAIRQLLKSRFGVSKQNGGVSSSRGDIGNTKS